MEGKSQEWLSLTHSVFERSYNPSILARAFIMFAYAFISSGELDAASAAARAAKNLKPDAEHLAELLGELDSIGSASPDKLENGDVEQILEAKGLPAGASVEVVVSILICADEAKKVDDVEESMRLVTMASDLIGPEATETLAQLVMES